MNIDVRVEALDSTGTTCASWVAYQDDYSLINATHLKQSDISTYASCAFPNGSLQFHVMGYAVPGQSRQIYLSALWDNEPTY